MSPRKKGVEEDRRSVRDVLQEITLHQHSIATWKILKDSLSPFLGNDASPPVKTITTPSCIEEHVPVEVVEEIATFIEQRIADHQGQISDLQSLEL